MAVLGGGRRSQCARALTLTLTQLWHSVWVVVVVETDEGGREKGGQGNNQSKKANWLARRGESLY